MNPFSKIRKLSDDRSKALAEIREMYDTADTEQRSLNATERAREDRLSAQIDEATDKIGEIAERNEGAGNGIEKAVTGMVDSLRSGKTGSVGEIDLRDDVTLTTTTATDGAELVAGETVGDIFDKLTHESMIVGLVSRMVTESGSSLRIPKATSYSAPSIVGEGSTVPKDAPQFDAVTLGSYKLGHSMVVSNELETDAAVDVVSWATNQSLAAIGRSMATYVIAGDGNNEPEGLIGSPAGVETTAADQITYDELVDAFHAVEPQYRTNGVWLFSDSALAGIRKMKDADGRPLWQPSPMMGQPATLLGRPVYSEPSLGALDGTAGSKFGMFGDLGRAYVLRVVGTIRVDRSEHAYFDSDLLGLRYLARFDGKIVDGKAVRSIATAA